VGKAVREMTDAERAYTYRNYRCCFCGSDRLVSGPRGGIMVNVECAHCGARLNIVHPAHHAKWDAHANHFGQVIHYPTKVHTPISLD
jgi:rRNA maturation protein Nop10